MADLLSVAARLAATVADADHKAIGGNPETASEIPTIEVAGFPQWPAPPLAMRIFRSRTGVDADATESASTDHVEMSYAVLWSENGGPTRAGKLELRAESLCFDGANEHGHVGCRLLLADIVLVTIARRPRERLGGRPALVLGCRDGGLVRLTTLSGAGELHELTDFVNARAQDVSTSTPRR